VSPTCPNKSPPLRYAVLRDSVPPWLECWPPPSSAARNFALAPIPRLFTAIVSPDGFRVSRPVRRDTTDAPPPLGGHMRTGHLTRETVRITWTRRTRVRGRRRLRGRTRRDTEIPGKHYVGRVHPLTTRDRKVYRTRGLPRPETSCFLRSHEESNKEVRRRRLARPLGRRLHRGGPRRPPLRAVVSARTTPEAPPRPRRAERRAVTTLIGRRTPKPAVRGHVADSLKTESKHVPARAERRPRNYALSPALSTVTPFRQPPRRPGPARLAIELGRGGGAELVSVLPGPFTCQMPIA